MSDCLYRQGQRSLVNVFSLIQSIFRFYFYFFLAMLGLHCCMWSFFSCDEWELFSSCAEQASYWSGLSYCGTWVLGPWASGVTAHGFNCSEACGISPDQGSNPFPLVLAGRFLTTGPPRESQSIFKVWVLQTFHLYIVIYLSFIFIGFLKFIHLHSFTFKYIHFKHLLSYLLCAKHCG